MCVEPQIYNDGAYPVRFHCVTFRRPIVRERKSRLDTNPFRSLPAQFQTLLSPPNNVEQVGYQKLTSTNCDRNEETTLLRISHASKMSDNAMDVDVSEEKKDTKTLDTAANAEVPVDRSSNEPSTGGAKTGEANAMAATSNGSSRDVTNNKDSTQTVEQTSAGNKDSTESTSNAGASPSKATKPGTGADDNTQTGKGSTQADKSEDNAAGVPTNKNMFQVLP